jgi:hypothetical protein
MSVGSSTHERKPLGRLTFPASVPTLAATAARMLGAMTEDLNRTGVEVRLARVVGQVHEILIG